MDPEGQEFMQSVYYGDPRLTRTWAPKMEFKGEGTAPISTETSLGFQAAGLKVGVCIRSQQLP